MRVAVALAAAAVVSFGASSMQAQREVAAGEWRAFAGTTHGHEILAARSDHQGQRQGSAGRVEVVVRRGRASRSRVRFSASSRNENTPLMANGVLYTVTGLGLVAALDPGTGQTRWVYDPESYKLGRPNNGGFLSRSFGYWTDGKASACSSARTTRICISIDTANRASPIRRSAAVAASI